MTFELSPFAKFPLEVKQKIFKEMWNYQGTNLSILETSHRSPVFAKVNQDTINSLRQYLQVPNNYKILLMQGGEQLTQASIPFNLANQKKSCNYLITGPRSTFAHSQALIHPDLKITTFSPQTFDQRGTQQSAYTYVCLQDHVAGQWFGQPEVKHGQTMVLDCTSILGLKAIDVAKYGIVFGSVQFSLGLAGVCVALLRDDLVGKQMKECPDMMSYTVMDSKNSIFNTPYCLAVYTLGEHIDYLIKSGGIGAVQHKVREMVEYLQQKLKETKHKVIRTQLKTYLVFSFALEDKSLQDSAQRTVEQKGILRAQNHHFTIKISPTTTKEQINQLFEVINQA